MNSTLAAKVIEGFHNEGWRAIGQGGTWAGAVRPLEQYIQRKVERAVRAEREACAKVCEQMPDLEHGWRVNLPSDCAAAIRARSNT